MRYILLLCSSGNTDIKIYQVYNLDLLVTSVKPKPFLSPAEHDSTAVKKVHFCTVKAVEL